jgi:hypothetical protein
MTTHCPPSAPITKKLAPGSNGTKRLLEKYGTALVCVRYRANGGTRFTTVEIVVDSQASRPRRAPGNAEVPPPEPQQARRPEPEPLAPHVEMPPPPAVTYVRVPSLEMGWNPRVVNARLRSLGATWDPLLNAWAMPTTVAARVGLTRWSCEPPKNWPGRNEAPGELPRVLSGTRSAAEGPPVEEPWPDVAREQ